MREFCGVLFGSLIIAAGSIGCSSSDKPAAPSSAASTTSVVESSLDTTLSELSRQVQSPLAQRFIMAAAELPPISDRTLYIRTEDKHIITPTEYESLQTEDSRLGIEAKTYDEHFYYFTRYGSPLYYAPALDLLAQHGLTDIDGKKIIDFGFGGIGQLRIMAMLGADVTGIEVDAVTRKLYTWPGDTGPIPRATIAGSGGLGSLNLVYGRFPADESVVDQIPPAANFFIARNVLKRGYIHPQREFRGSMDPLIDLGVSDEEFLQAIYGKLAQGGYFMIYNLCPIEVPEGEEGWVPWADGRSPFDQQQLEQAGFRVLAYNIDDSRSSLPYYASLGMGPLEDLPAEVYSMYTIVRKPIW